MFSAQGVNGREKVSQSATQNVATLGSCIRPPRHAATSGRPRLLLSLRLPGRLGPLGLIACDVCGGLRLVLADLAQAKAVAVTIHLKDVHLVSHPGLLSVVEWLGTGDLILEQRGPAHLI